MKFNFTFLDRFYQGRMLFHSSEYRLPVLLSGCLLIAAFFLYGEAAKARRAAEDAAEQITACQELSKQIIALKKRPELVSASTRSSAQIAQAVEAGLLQAEISAERLVRIDPRAARRHEKSPFLEQPSHLELREVTMEQLVKFLLYLAKEHRLETTELRLLAPRTADAASGPEFWNAELLLTNTIYSP